MAIFIEDDTIPPVLYAALKSSNEEYSKEVRQYLIRHGQDLNFSATSLNKPIKQLILEKRHADEMQINPLENNWHSMLGSSIHLILEQQAYTDPRYEAEVRKGFNTKILGQDVHIHGKYDLYDFETDIVQDWKVTSASSMLYPKTEFERQLNLIGYILREHGRFPAALQNVYLFPHLDKTKMSKPDYPKRNCKVVTVPFDFDSNIIDHFTIKISAYINSINKKDKDLPACSDEERWIRGYLYKGYSRKKGGKKGVINDFSKMAAIKSESMDDLIKYKTENKIEDSDFKITTSKPAPKYCSFCSAAPFCHQHQEYVRQQEKQFS